MVNYSIEVSLQPPNKAEKLRNEGKELASKWKIADISSLEYH